MAVRFMGDLDVDLWRGGRGTGDRSRPRRGARAAAARGRERARLGAAAAVGGREARKRSPRDGSFVG